jgi:nonsense-mediated mRNA decay protein 3
VKCFRCGKREAVVDGLCKECYLETHRILDVPDYIDLKFCAHCGAISSDGNRWKDYDDFEKGIMESALQFISISRDVKLLEMDTELIERDPRTYTLRGNALFKIGDSTENLDFESTIRLKRTTCPRCSRINGGYYEAIIQVRGSHREMSEGEKIESEEFIASRIESMGKASRDIFITDEEEIHGGLDFYISNAKAAKSVAKEFANHVSGNLTESKKLAGRKEGEDIYRFTYLVRLPEFGKGDFVEYMGEKYQIVSNSGKTWKLYSLEKRRDIKVNNMEAKKFRLLAKKEDVEEVVVVSYREGEAQVLHPDTYRTVTLQCAKDPGEKMKIIKIDRELYSLREDD